MKTLRILILGWLMTAMVGQAQQTTESDVILAAQEDSLNANQTALATTSGQAQITDPGWYKVPPRNTNTLAMPENSGAPQVTALPTVQNSMSVQALNSQQNPSDIAATITPNIQALADGLQDNPVKIYNYVHDHIKYVLYFGSKKGAELTLLEKSGNDFDQSSLLVALLRAAGYNATYQFGWMELPYDNPDGSDRDLHHWLQLNLSNTNWNYTSNYLFNLFWNVRGYPMIDYLNRYPPYTDTNTFMFQRVWVVMTLNGTNYYLDPAFKVSEPITNLVNLTTATGLSSNALMSAAGGTDTGNYVQSLNEANLRNKLTSYTTNLLGYLQTHDPNASMKQVLGGWQIVPATNTTLPTSLIFPTISYEPPAPMYVTNWTAIPTNLMATLKISFGNTNYQWFMPQLEGQRLSLTFDSSGNAQLWQDDTLLAQSSTTSSQTNVELYENQPFGSWDATNNTLIPDSFADLDVTTAYQRTSATYALMYAFEPDWGWLQERENKLDNYLAEGLSPTSRQVTSETLNIMGLKWMLETEYAGHLIERQLGILPQFDCRLGRMAQESGHGYYVDAYMELSGFVSNSGEDAANKDKENRDFDLFSYFGSALENGIIEQLQDSNLVGASTAKMLEIANADGQPVYLGTSNNWESGPNILGTLINYYDFDTLVQLTEKVMYDGYSILLPENGSNYVAGVGSWRGYGYVAHVNNTSNQLTAFTISGGYNGGYSSSSTAQANPSFVDYTGDSASQYYNSAPVYTLDPTAADPVDMADGTFQIEHTDLSVGQKEPRGISLSRYYNGTRRFSNPAGMADGWINNYCVNVATVSAPEAGLGGTTPEQAAPMLVATCAAISLYNDANPEPKNWMVTDLIAKWGIDQLTTNGASANLGKDTVQFIKQPNSVYTPPANCTMTLIQTNGVYWLQQRHGNTFKFDSLGRLTNIVDQYNQPLTVSYLSSTSSLPQTVADWKGRTLTFNYTGGQLTSVADSTGRSVSYGYNAQGDLSTFTDAEQQPTTYLYDTNHQITAVFNALNQLVVSNVYNSQGHIATQYTEGDTNKAWKIYWSGWQTVVQDPAGGQQTYFYDDQSRLVETEDALGNPNELYYDGQNHVIMTVSPLDETNQYFYDGNNNLVESIDPLGYTNQFFYDNQNRLYRSTDGRDNPTTYGYNAEFSLTGQTNGAGDWVNYTYNTSGANAGTMATKTDPGGTTSYSYDSTYGQLNGITYPGSLGSESFVTDARGDVTSHTDGNGNTTAFYYNNRRELTNTIAPTNVVTSVAYDPNDNVAGTTDARRNSTTNTWSATRKLLTTTLPAVAAGTPVTTRVYDNRDWLSETLDPLEAPTLYTNNLNGWLISQTDPLLRTTMFSYDADGRKLATVNAAYETNSQTWDARGKLIALTDGAQHTSLRAYDGAGNQIILTNRNGKVWQFQFDGANRLTNTIPPSPMRPFSQTWNLQGLVSTTTDPAHQTTHFYYDGKNRLANRTDNTGTTLYSYDDNDNRTSVSENGLTNTWTYDAYNRVSTYKDAYGNLIQYKYDPNGNLTNLVYPGDKNVYYFYDNDNQLTNVTDWAHRKTSFTYDLDGRLKTITRPNRTQRIISYDSAGQETNILEENAAGFPIALIRQDWNHAGEMQWEFAAPLPHTNAPPYRTMTYHDDNELATVDSMPVTEDYNGNLTDGPLTNDNFVTYHFDARNRLEDVGGVTNFYDGMNNRIGQTYGTNSIEYVVNPNARLPQVLMRIKNGVTNYYVYGKGLLYQVTETTNGETTLTYHYDYRGSTIALTDGNGNVKDRFEYSLYATLTYRAGTDDTPFLFNGRYGVQSDNNGLLYLRARYYNPFICRFISSDPSGFAGGLNWYAYANGNPVSYLDASGLSAQATGDSFFTWLLNATPADLANPFGLSGSGENLPTMQDIMNAPPEWAIEAYQAQHPTAYQPTEPSVSQFMLTFIGMAFDNPELGDLGTVGNATTKVAETGAKPFAMGLDAELDSFAQARGATTWKQFPNPENWKSGVLDKLADPNTPVHFNLNGVDVWGGVQRAASGAGGATDWELLQIQQNSQFWDTMTFWKNGQVAPNPFH